MSQEQVVRTDSDQAEHSDGRHMPSWAHPGFSKHGVPAVRPSLKKLAQIRKQQHSEQQPQASGAPRPQQQ